MELIFFTADHKLLCFEFLTKPALIPHDFLAVAEQCWLIVMAFCFFSVACIPIGWGRTRSQERTQPGQLTPADQNAQPRSFLTFLSLFSPWSGQGSRKGESSAEQCLGAHQG